MICPRCGAECERDEADVGIGTIGGAWGCPECHWVDSASQELFQAMDEGQGASIVVFRCECGHESETAKDALAHQRTHR